MPAGLKTSMKVLYKKLPPCHSARTAVATVGIFDGVHRGHRWIIQRCVALARKSPRCFPLVVTFFPAPESVLAGARHFHLTGLEEKIEAIRKAGCPYMIVLRFDKRLAEYTGEDFIRRLLRTVSIRHLLVGEDFKFGKNRFHGIPFLRDFLKERGGSVRIYAKRIHHGVPVSSSCIRALLLSGDVEKSCNLLGQPYSLTAEVVTGKGIGRVLGVPTANLHLDEDKLIPGNGVYIVQVAIAGKKRWGVCNVGYSPTLDPGSSRKTVEVHILRHHRSLLRKEITVSFIKKIRDEKRFASLIALRSAIQKDIAACQNYQKE